MAINTNTDSVVREAIKKELCGDKKKYKVKKLTAVEAATRRGIEFADTSGEGVWRTIQGRKVFIKKGQSVKDAMSSSGKFKKSKSDVEKVAAGIIKGTKAVKKGVKGGAVAAIPVVASKAILANVSSFGTFLAMKGGGLAGALATSTRFLAFNAPQVIAIGAVLGVAYSLIKNRKKSSNLAEDKKFPVGVPVIGEKEGKDILAMSIGEGDYITLETDKKIVSFSKEPIVVGKPMVVKEGDKVYPYLPGTDKEGDKKFYANIDDAINSAEKKVKK